MKSCHADKKKLSLHIYAILTLKLQYLPSFLNAVNENLINIKFYTEIKFTDLIFGERENIKKENRLLISHNSRNFLF